MTIAQMNTTANTDRATLLTMLLALMMASCASKDNPNICTEIGCGQPTIILTLTDARGDEVESFTGEVTIGQTVHSVACGGETPATDPLVSCDNNLLVITHDSVPSEIAVNLRAASDQSLAAIGGVAITRVTRRPNGEDCPPECESGTGEVRFEPTQATGP